MPTKKLVCFIAVLVIIGAGTFYGGLKYRQSKSASKLTPGGSQDLQNLSPEQRQQMFSNRGGAVAGARAGTNMVRGDIIAKDDKSITVELRVPQGVVGQDTGSQESGSRIVFFSDSTKITKSTEGSLNDLEIGETVNVGGKQNSDGSFIAETIQLMPAATITPEVK